MASTYTTNLRLTLPTTGELAGTWGDTVNTGLTALADAAIAGTAAVTMTAADKTLSVANGATDEARQMFINLTGTPGASFNVIVPTSSKLYFVKNGTGFAQTVKTAAGGGISVPTGSIMALYCDGTSVVDAITSFSSIGLATPLAVSSGGIGAATLTGIAKGNGTSAFTAATAGTDYVAPGGALGTPSSGTLTNCTFPTLNQDTTGTAAKTNALNSATTVVNVSSATAPSAGQVLTATSSTAATWQTTSGVSLSGTNTWTGLQTFSVGSVSTPERETAVSVAASAINLATGNYFYKTIAANTTFTVSNTPASGTAQSFILELTNGGAFTITWFAGLTFVGGVAPVLTASGRDVLSFFTRDGGTTWSGFVVGKDVK